MALVTVKGLRGIQWDKSNDWEITIEGFNFQNRGFFPANDFELTFFGVENEQVSSTGVEIPKNRTIPNVTLSYIDDENLTTTKFFTDWQRSLVSSDGYKVLPLMESYKTIHIHKLNSMKEKIIYWKLKGFPTGNIQYHGDSDGSIPIYSINFTIVGGGLKWNNA
jgi:hypothetical protein